MKVNGVQVYTAAQIKEIWSQKRKSTTEKIKKFAAEGYVFVTNNNHNFGYTAKWEAYQPIKVAQATQGAGQRVLWAIKPSPSSDMEEYYSNKDWR